jgi:hypothetical protein
MKLLYVWIRVAHASVCRVVAQTLVSAASRLVSTLFFPRQQERRHECRRGTHEFVRHIVLLVCMLQSAAAQPGTVKQISHGVWFREGISGLSVTATTSLSR